MSALATRPELARTFSSMASTVELRVVDPGPDAEAAMDRAEQVVLEVARRCTRFDEDSALSQVNREPETFHLVPAVLADAIDEAALAHKASDGLFDPRVLDTLIAWGYDRAFVDVVARASVRADVGPAGLPAGLVEDARSGPSNQPSPARQPRPAWAPVVLPGRGRRMVRPGAALDLGGIAKGLAVRWAAAELVGSGSALLVDAGGDLMLGGAGPDGTGWRVGVEDPHGEETVAASSDAAGSPMSPASEEQPVLVLELTDLGCATSSVRRRRWRSGGTEVHHLVDPRTSRPGGAGLASVTVVHPDPAWAEVWSKTLFLVGEEHVAREAERRGLAAAWVSADGRIGTSAVMDPFVLWRAR